MFKLPTAVRGGVRSTAPRALATEISRISPMSERPSGAPLAVALRIAICASMMAALAAGPFAAHAGNGGRSTVKRVNDARPGAGAGDINTTDLETMTVHGVRGPEFVRPSLAGYNYSRGGPGGGSSGTGGGVIDNRGAKEQPTSDKLGDCGGTSSNPIVLFSGNKVEPELDFAGSGEMALFLQRTYNNYWSATGLFGDRWLSNFDYTLAPSTAGGQNLLWAQRPDGRRIKFVYNATTARWNEDKPSPIAYIVKQSDGGYLMHNEGNGQERYNADGYILELQNEAGVRWSFAYDGKYLRQVTHSSGRTIGFGWTGNQLTQVTAPNGAVYFYTYRANALGNQRNLLTSTTLPGTPAVKVDYHYEDARFPGGLTGKSFNSVRYSTFAYDEEGRAIKSEHAGGVERSTFAYTVEASQTVTPPPAPPRPGGSAGGGDQGWCEQQPGHGQVCYQPMVIGGGGEEVLAARDMAMLADAPVGKPTPAKLKVVETNPLGKQTIHRFEDDRSISVEGAASQHCAATYREQTYDANGNPDIVADFAGNLTNFDYDGAARLRKRVDAAGSPVERTSTYVWDDATGRLLRETVAGDHETSYTYTAAGRPETVAVKNLSAVGVKDQVLTTTYSYNLHPNGLIATATVDGPIAGSGDAVTSTYSAAGELLSVVNSLGHAITYSGYNGLGLPGKITGVNGDVTEYDYDVRGRVIAERRVTAAGVAETRNRYAQDLLAATTSADGVETRYEYDAARRLTDEYRQEADGSYSRRHYELNAMSRPTSIEVSRTNFTPDTRVAGNVEGLIREGNQYSLSGWACSTGVRDPIDVDVYAGSSFLARARAEWDSEPAIAAACGTQGSRYRFRVPLTLEMRQQRGGQALNVYGISPTGVGANNLLLNGSGAYTIPAAAVIGDIGGTANDAQWNYFVWGWACSVGVSAPIDLQLYAGGPYGGGGTFIGTYHADLEADGPVQQACESGIRAHRFSIALPVSVRRQYGNQPIYIHGMSPVGQANPTITHSGAFAIPAAIDNAELVSYQAPGHMISGQTTNITVQMRNTGNLMWGSAENGNYYLGKDSVLYAQPERIAIGGPVAPGQIATFTYSFKAGRTATSQNVRVPFGGRMIGDVTGWFGPASPIQYIEVEDPTPHCSGRICENPR